MYRVKRWVPRRRRRAAQTLFLESRDRKWRIESCSFSVRKREWTSWRAKTLRRIDWREKPGLFCTREPGKDFQAALYSLLFIGEFAKGRREGPFNSARGGVVAGNGIKSDGPASRLLVVCSRIESDAAIENSGRTTAVDPSNPVQFHVSCPIVFFFFFLCRPPAVCALALRRVGTWRHRR